MRFKTILIIILSTLFTSQIIYADEFKLTPLDETENRFGSSVSISGNTAIVGASHDDDKGIDAGAAYIFVYNGTSWQQQAKLTAEDGQAGDNFGCSVSIYDNDIIVGAMNNGAGAAYIFSFNNDEWLQKNILNQNNADNLEPLCQFLITE
ncbi:MAG: hypothetical protein OMM_07079 [Candidatus Magnetoglobus multicellularis str. Araruama]|uniref:PKD domain-containing protein n=1 Tax=Candidatus Magnetoglobus multicellularis str. Araruama TaxID=890399 RepID=A0A1V1PEJ3_9BACT|nr:MAG: hypothetical protein OMM_07079 [Candidatus Magnetoglobus multicellularis str. Araruama]